MSRPGELVAVVGPNGAGKTTLLSILAGVQRASAGRGDRLTSSARRTAIGWAPQQPALYSKLSVEENLRLFARLERVADPEGAVASMLEQTGLSRAGARARRAPLGRQSPARQRRARAARATRGAAARRALGRARPAPARAAVGAHRLAPRRAAARACCSPPTISARSSDTRRVRSCWPTASCCSTGRRDELVAAGAVPRISRRRSSLPGRARSLTVRWLLRKGSDDPRPLAVAGCRCWSSTPSRSRC